MVLFCSSGLGFGGGQMSRPLPLTVRELSSLTSTPEQVVEVFFRTHARGWELVCQDGLSVVVRVSGSGRLVGQGCLPVPLHSPATDFRENWWFLLGLCVGLRQGGAR